MNVVSSANVKKGVKVALRTAVPDAVNVRGRFALRYVPRSVCTEAAATSSFEVNAP